MLVGPAGCGKTTMASQLAEALELQFASVCLTSGASETWLFGRQTPNGFVEGPFAKLYREGGVFLADEMDAADANLLLSLNTALSHSQIINPMSGETLVKHKDFIFVGAANTNGKGATQVYTGRTRLDAATLDRFVIFNVDYDQELEKELCPDETLYNILNEVRRELKNEGQDEFVSTRAFKNLYRLNQSGLDLDELFAILTANWGDQSTKIAMNVVQSAKKGKPKSGKKAELSKIEIPF
jgi:MoxR-like ATPase